MPCIDRLIALPIFQFLFDIRGQWHFPKPLQNLQENAGIVELDQLIPIAALPHHGGGQFTLSKREFCSRLCLSAWLGETFPNTVSQILQKKHFYCAACGHAVSQQSGRQDA